MRDPWPGRDQVVRTLRTVLRREFGADDAWVVAGRDGVRLEVRAGGRTRVLLAAPEPEFWPRFYKEGLRQRRHLGEIETQIVPRRRSGEEIAAILRDLWPGGAAEPDPR